MRKLPKVSGLVLCDRMDVDPHQGTYSLVNVFNQLRFRRPGPLLKPFTVYATLFDGEGDGPMELFVMHMETERDIYKHSKWYTYPDRGMFNLLELKVTKCRFRVPGRYVMSLRIDRVEIANRYLDVVPE